MIMGRILEQLVWSFFLLFFSELQPGVICVTFYDKSAAHSSTNHCNCLWKSHHLSSCAQMSIEKTIQSRLWLISASVYQPSRKWLQQKSKRTGKRWCHWRRMVRRPWMFRWALQCQFRWFEKVPNFMVGQVLCCLTLQATSFFLWRIQYMFTLICLWYLCASVVNQSMTQTTGSFTCLPYLLMHVFTHMFCLPLFIS